MYIQGYQSKKLHFQTSAIIKKKKEINFYRRINY